MATVLQRIRRNHAIEHAALHMLAATMARPRLAARSDWAGVTFYGRADPALLSQGLERALDALRNGQRHLAVHPRCGSGLSVASLLAFLPMWATLRSIGPRHRILGTVIAFVSMISGLILADPVGKATQAHLLTEPLVSDAHIVSIRSTHQGPLAVSRVTIAHR
ncbi:MAG: hypothetical protein GXX94_09355 [Chloroflexi bacterium]|nr:hypothetical protein [Chloroflexota bacterium]